jgi:hypothetical protein
MSLLGIHPQSHNVDDQSNSGNCEEFHLQMERQHSEEQFNFRLDGGANQNQFHQLLPLLLVFTYICDQKMNGDTEQTSD